MQYTHRGIPPTGDAKLRRRAALIRGAGLSEAPVRQRDLGDIVGAWQEDPDFDQAIAEQDQIDERLWR